MGSVRDYNGRFNRRVDQGNHPTVGVAVFAPKRPWAIEFLM